MKPLLLLTLLLVSSPVFACDSFEECIDLADPSEYGASLNALKAIAYKLDEISNKLPDKNPVISLPEAFAKRNKHDKTSI